MLKPNPLALTVQVVLVPFINRKYRVLYEILSRHKWSPPQPVASYPRPFVANFPAIDGPLGQSMAATDVPLCHKWSPSIFESRCHL